MQKCVAENGVIGSIPALGAGDVGSKPAFLIYMRKWSCYV
jgi:hypothetical protein